MTHDDAFLHDIVAHPGDDTPRLIFADWLDEHGQPERAEFIRVQCELAKYPPENSMSLGIYGTERMERGRALRCHEQELLDDHWSQWVREVVGGLAYDVGVATSGSGTSFKVSLYDRQYGKQGHLECVFHRGFIDEVSWTLAGWFGEECRECYRGSVPTDRDDNTCEVCHGTGRTGGYGPQLVRTTPIERVVLTDRMPGDFTRDGQTLWSWDSHGCLGDYCWYLPKKIEALLPSRCNNNPQGSAWYQSRQAALDALSRALLVWAGSPAFAPARAAVVI